MTPAIRMPEVGEVVGGAYRLDALLGRGGHGVVYSAEVVSDTAGLAPGARVAVKMLRPHALENPVLMARMLREAELVGSLRSPHTVRVMHHGVHDAPGARSVPFLVCELLVGQTLSERLVGGKSIDALEAVEILRQTLLSLAEAHEHGIIHRDIKPGNIFLVESPTTRVKVLDFGVAKPTGGVDPGLTSAGTAPGTVAYMAPEQAMGRDDLTPAADVYSVGCVAYRMLSGKLPYSGRSPLEVSVKHVSSPVPALPRSLAQHEIGSVVRRALEKDRENRFPDARAFLEALPDTERVATVVHSTLDTGIHRPGESNREFDTSDTTASVQLTTDAPTDVHDGAETTTHTAGTATTVTRIDESAEATVVNLTSPDLKHMGHDATVRATARRPRLPLVVAVATVAAGGLGLVLLGLLGVVQWATAPEAADTVAPSVAAEPPAPPRRVTTELPLAAPVDPWITARPSAVQTDAGQSPVPDVGTPAVVQRPASAVPAKTAVEPVEPVEPDTGAPAATVVPRRKKAARRPPRRKNTPAAAPKRPAKPSGPKIDLFKKKD